MPVTRNVYVLPFKKKELIKAISHPKVHFAHFKEAIDFILPKGTMILAPKTGKVVDMKINSKEGGADQKYNNLKYLNYLTLQHTNGEYSQFAHLKYKGSLVKLGDSVKEREPIAISGNTGFTTAPHLHFHVFKLVNTKIGWISLKIRFKEKIRIDKTNSPLSKKFNKTLNSL